MSRDRLDLTPCFKHSVLLGAFSIVVMVAFVARIVRLRVSCTPHHLGRTAWIYWPTQVFMGLAGILALINACLQYWRSDGTPASIVGYLCFGSAWILALVLNHEEHQYTIRSSDLLYSFHVLSISFLISILLDPQSRSGDTQLTLLVVLTCCLILGFVVEAWPRTNTRVQQLSSSASAYDKANLFSRCTFHFFQPIVSLSIKKTLTMDDLQNQLPDFIKTDQSYHLLEGQWRKNVMKSQQTGRSVSLLWTIFQVNAKAMVPVLFFRTIRPSLLFSIPGLLSLFLGYLQDVGTEKEKSPTYGFLIAGAMFAAAFAGAIIQAVSRQYSMHLSLRIKVALTAMIYRKALRLSPESRQQSTTGEIMNHMSVDTDVWTDAMFYLSMWVSLPVEIGIAMWLLYRLLGWSFLAGIAALLIMTPLQVWRARVYNKMRKDKLSIMDERVRLTSEVFAASKIVKLYCWEAAFKQRIFAIRNRELEALKKLGRLFAVMSIIFTSSTMIISLLTLSVYAKWGGEGFTEGKMTPQTVFVSMTLFGMLRKPFASLAEATSKTLATLVSTARIEKFLLLEEIQEEGIIREKNVPEDPSIPVVLIEDGTFSWIKSAPAYGDNSVSDMEDENRPLLTSEEDGRPPATIKPALEGINISISKGSLTAVVGRVGQGKSSLLSAIIGEMYRSKGEVRTRGLLAYVPQHAWILNCSLRENILFGKPFEPERYNRVLFACGLEPDIAILPAGDLTEIGERGVNLSGGQKQRVSLARAAYSDVDIYLLDDPLSAVDAHVDRHLWRHLIGPDGLLKDKTRILATHGIHHLKNVDRVLMIKDGRVAECGTFAGLMSERRMLYALMKEYAIENRRNSEGGPGLPVAEHPTSSENEAVTQAQSEPRCEDDQSNTTSLDSMDLEVNSSGQSTPKGPGTDVSQVKTTLNGKLIEEEKIKEGHVGFGVALTYLKAVSYKYAILVALFLILAQVAVVGINLWLKYWINQSEEAEEKGTQPPSLRLFLSVFAALTAVYVSACIIEIYIGFVFGVIRASYTLHRDLISRILRLPSLFFDTTPLGRIINRISSDMEVIDNSIAWSFDDVVMLTVALVSTMIIVSVTTPMFLSVLPVLSILVLVIQQYYLHASQAIKRIFHVSKSPLYQHFNESLGGVSTIRAMQLQDRFIIENGIFVDAHTNYHLALLYCIRWVEVRLQCLSAIIALFVSVAFVYNRSGIDPSTAGLAMSFVLTITQDMNYLVVSYCELQNRLIPVERVREYVDLPTEAPERLPMSDTTKEKWPPKEGRITFDHYSTRYREGLDLVLKNISFEVQPGESVGIVGRTGAGKSSLTLALFRMIEAANSHWNNKDSSHPGSGISDSDYANGSESGGKIEIDGVDISTLGLVDLRQALAIIPQDPILFAGSVRDNLDPFQEHSDHALWQALERAHLKEHIQSVPGGLSYEVAQHGENFSVGQRSLICLARALLRKTKILVLDEATSAVDVETDELIQKTIRAEFKDRTILTIAHRIKTIMDSDKILVLEQGQVAEFDRPEALLLKKEGSLFYRLAKQAGEVVGE